MKLICSQCDAAIPGEDVNVAEGICYCRKCDEAFRIASFLTETEVVQRTEQPAGSQVKVFEREDAYGFVIPSEGLGWSAIFLLFFSLIWNGISWTGFIGGLLEQAWGTTLFLVPFVLIGVATVVMFFFFWKGYFSFMIDQTQCIGAWCLFGLRYRKVIGCHDITGVTQDVIYSKNYQPMYGVSIQYGSGKSIKFGSSLTEDERIWIKGEIKHFLEKHQLGSNVE